ncbi:hypothetical protein OW565_04670 [Acidithiobacillus ferriphilus]|uniref:hypothetical protein n=1 Tax=Acidithiobacillus ferriphilus TaxID=1689834 RepID=UPI001C07D88A|nr:hypothetical protein [Acidithiobacillus ferriphilus]MBU2849409.1 hypothetical protein [Acidithiobacillus ferriphilus]MEB8535467.1 hypothetical protein [Acidithiobacillus ferriphilus]
MIQGLMKVSGQAPAATQAVSSPPADVEVLSRGLVLNRFCDPESKLGVLRWVETVALPNITVTTITLSLFRRRGSARRLALCFWTSFIYLWESLKRKTAMPRGDRLYQSPVAGLFGGRCRV